MKLFLGRLSAASAITILLCCCATQEQKPQAKRGIPQTNHVKPAPAPKIKLGQTRAEVWAAYGRPFDVVRGRGLEVWSYENGSEFDFKEDRIVRLPETFPPVAKNPGAFLQPAPDDAPGTVDLGARSKGKAATARVPSYPSRGVTSTRQRGPLDMSRPVPVREHQRRLPSGRVITVRSHTRNQ